MGHGFHDHGHSKGGHGCEGRKEFKVYSTTATRNPEGARMKAEMLEETKERHIRICCESRWHVYEVLGGRKIDCLELETSTETKKERIGRLSNREGIPQDRRWN